MLNVLKMQREILEEYLKSKSKKRKRCIVCGRRIAKNITRCPRCGASTLLTIETT
jgi:rRNA maturation endonuclease Nob1